MCVSTARGGGDGDLPLFVVLKEECDIVIDDDEDDPLESLRGSADPEEERDTHNPTPSTTPDQVRYCLVKTSKLWVICVVCKV